MLIIVNKPSAFVLQMPVPTEKQNIILFLERVKFYEKPTTVIILLSELVYLEKYWRKVPCQ
jgi:hypothetical protein